MTKQQLEWYKVDEQLPAPETFVLTRFDDGTIMYIWQNWEETGVKDVEEGKSTYMMKARIGDDEYESASFGYMNDDDEPIVPIEWAYV